MLLIRRSCLSPYKTAPGCIGLQTPDSAAFDPAFGAPCRRRLADQKKHPDLPQDLHW